MVRRSGKWSSQPGTQSRGSRDARLPRRGEAGILSRFTLGPRPTQSLPPGHLDARIAVDAELSRGWRQRPVYCLQPLRARATDARGCGAPEGRPLPAHRPSVMGPCHRRAAGVLVRQRFARTWSSSQQPAWTGPARRARSSTILKEKGPERDRCVGARQVPSSLAL